MTRCSCCILYLVLITMGQGRERRALKSCKEGAKEERESGLSHHPELQLNSSFLHPFVKFFFFSSPHVVIYSESGPLFSKGCVYSLSAGDTQLQSLLTWLARADGWIGDLESGVSLLLSLLKSAAGSFSLCSSLSCSRTLGRWWGWIQGWSSSLLSTSWLEVQPENSLWSWTSSRFWAILFFLLHHRLFAEPKIVNDERTAQDLSFSLSPLFHDCSSSFLWKPGVAQLVFRHPWSTHSSFKEKTESWKSGRRGR